MRELLILIPVVAGCAQSAEYAPEPDAPAAVEATPEAPQSGDTMDAIGEVSGLVEVFMAADALDMGLDPADPDYDDYHYVQTVELSNNWAIMQTEVTHEMWETLMSHPLRGVDGAPLLDGDCDTCPAHNVSWHEAQAFANALSEAQGLEQCFSCEGEGQDTVGFQGSDRGDQEVACQGDESRSGATCVESEANAAPATLPG